MSKWSHTEGLQELTKRLVQEWSEYLRKLLEEKHLYQNVEVPVSVVMSSITANIHEGQLQHFNLLAKHWEERRLVPAMKLSGEGTSISGAMVQITPPILLVTNAKLFCSICGGPEVFSPLWAKDVATECLDHRGGAMPRKDNSHLIFLAFQCQRWGSDPEGFIVRRKNYRLYLEGRSPIEHVEVPRYLPKQEAHFFSDAVIAFNAGKKLAGLFYLRVFLEQFDRRVTGIDGRIAGEELMNAYAETLPVAHRDYMPSFREWYDKLSAALHGAIEDEGLFEGAKSEIDKHFDIRRVFKISEAIPPSEANDTVALEKEN